MKHLYALFTFPHDDAYFDIKPEGVCSSHIHWTNDQLQLEHEDVIDRTAGFVFQNVEIVSH